MANVGSASIALVANQDGEREFILSEENAAALTGGRRRRKSRKSSYVGGDAYTAGDSAANPEMYAAAFKTAQSQLPLYQATLKNQSGGNNAEKMYNNASAQLPLLNGIKQNGGNTGAIVNLASTRSVVTPGANQPLPGVSGKPMEELGSVQSGGVILRSKKSKISLKAPKKLKIASTTRKIRKIKVGVKGLKTRLNHAKKAHNHAQTVSLPIVKQRLVKAGVIKASTKAPEHMLRNMYADLLVTKKGL